MPTQPYKAYALILIISFSIIKINSQTPPTLITNPYIQASSFDIITVQTTSAAPAPQATATFVNAFSSVPSILYAISTY